MLILASWILMFINLKEVAQGIILLLRDDVFVYLNNLSVIYMHKLQMENLLSVLKVFAIV